MSEKVEKTTERLAEPQVLQTCTGDRVEKRGDLYSKFGFVDSVRRSADREHSGRGASPSRPSNSCHHPEEGGSHSRSTEATSPKSIRPVSGPARHGNQIPRMRVGVEAIGLKDHDSVSLQDRPSEASSIGSNLLQAFPIA